MVCSAGAQSAHYVGTERQINIPAVYTPGQIAIDQEGNLFITDTGHNRITEERALNGEYQQCVLDANGFNGPLGIASDLSGNLYVADSGNDRIVEEIRLESGYIAKVLPVLGLNHPVSIAVDSSGDLYIADAGNSRVVKASVAGSGYKNITLLDGVEGGEIAIDADRGKVYLAVPSSGEVIMSSTATGSTPIVVASGLSTNLGIAVSQSGAIYIADSGNARLLGLYNTDSAFTHDILIATRLATPTYLAIDSSDTLYFADGDDQALTILALNGYNFGSVPIHSTTRRESFLFSFDSAGRIASPSVVLQGMTGLDFADAGTGSCTTNGPEHEYFVGESCTVDVTFTPRRAGWRYGAALLFNKSGYSIATAYMQGNGVGPHLVFPPGMLKASDVGLSKAGAYRMDVDDRGNLYISDAVARFSADNKVVKETKVNDKYIYSLVATNLVYPHGIAVDGAGDVYVIDEQVILKCSVTLDKSYTCIKVEELGSDTNALAVDGLGTLYFVSDGNANISDITIDSPRGEHHTDREIRVAGRVDAIVVDGSQNIYTTSEGVAGSTISRLRNTNTSYSSPTLISGLGADSLAIDNTGDIYWVAGTNEVKKLHMSGTAPEESTVGVSDTPSASAVSVDGEGNLYWVNELTGAVEELDFGDPPNIRFSAMKTGLASSNSPQTLSIANMGSANLYLSIPTSGTNPVLPEGFSITTGRSQSCPVQTADSRAVNVLAAGTSCQYEVTYSPINSADNGGWMIFKGGVVSPASHENSEVAFALTVDKSLLSPIVNWVAPSKISYGTPLSVKQLSATASVAGSFAYIPSAGALLSVGTHTLKATFTPFDSDSFSMVTASVEVTVTQAQPIIQWAPPSAITYGTPLSSAQLNASSNVAGSFIYSPAAGVVLNAGVKTLSVTFIPDDMSDYTTAIATVPLTVNKATPVINWITPSAIVFGTFLSSAQLNATASVPGSFVYSPDFGAVVPVGSDILSATFTPIDSSDFSQAADSVTLAVNEPVPTIDGLSPAEAVAGGTGFTLTIYGTGFTSASTASWGSTPLTISAVSPTQTTVQVPSSLIAFAGMDSITMQNPAPGGGTSNQFQFAVVSGGSASGISYLSQTATVLPGATASYPVTVSSSVQIVSSTCINLPSDAICSYSPSAGAVTIATNSTTPTGTYQITVVFTESVPTTAVAIPLFFLPLLPLMYLRKGAQANPLWWKACLGILFAVAALATGCGRSSGSGGVSDVQVTTATTITLTVL